MRKQLISLNIALGPYNKFVDKICDMAIARRSSYTCVANVHMLVEAKKDPYFAEIVNAADIVTPDGMPLAKGLLLTYGLKQDRVAGMTLLPDLLEAASKKPISVYFYGSTTETLELVEKHCTIHYPKTKLAGMYSPPFRPLSDEEECTVIKEINESGANLIFVCLGCPKQEKWMHSMKGKINGHMIGIGGALPVMIGVQTRAPKWMQDASLEWLYRLGQEPRRLFKRYAVTNSLFIYYLLKETLAIRLVAPIKNKLIHK